jgi:probable F420-dependent oxidoreductase
MELADARAAAVSTSRPFRFGVTARRAGSRAEWRGTVRRTAELGYDILVVSDHLDGQIGTVPAIVAAADVDPGLRVGSLVFAVGFRHPAVLAVEVATIDLLVDGRFEVGLGTGWLPTDYASAGIAFEPPRVRVRRLEETAAILLACRREEPATFHGSLYSIDGLRTPRAVQRPGVPLLIAAGGERMLGIAAARADIVSVMLAHRPGTGLDWRDLTESRVAQKVGRLRDRAGSRVGELELNVLLQRVDITDRRGRAAERLAAELGHEVDDLLSSPYLAVGTAAQVADELRRHRAELGISYLTVKQRDMEAFAPVVAQLRGA